MYGFHKHTTVQQIKCHEETKNIYVIIARLQKLGVYGIYNPMALGCGTRVKQGHC